MPKSASNLQRGKIGTSCQVDKPSDKNTEDFLERQRLSEEYAQLRKEQEESWSYERQKEMVTLARDIDGEVY